MTQGWFVTGTDTGIGKTFVAELMLEGLNAAGVAAVGMKPVASGCRESVAGVRSEDAERLITASHTALPYDSVNPYAYVEPVAPHIAAQLASRPIDINVIRTCFTQLADAGYVVVEGVGGWRVPIGGGQTMADVAAALELPIVLVVGVRLGCINHALLTAEAIAADGMVLAGWVANTVVPDTARQVETISAIEAALGAPRLATIPYRLLHAARAPLAQALVTALMRA